MRRAVVTRVRIALVTCAAVASLGSVTLNTAQAELRMPKSAFGSGVSRSSSGSSSLQTLLGEPLKGRLTGMGDELVIGFWAPWPGGTTAVTPDAPGATRTELGLARPNPSAGEVNLSF